MIYGGSFHWRSPNHYCQSHLALARGYSHWTSQQHHYSKINFAHRCKCTLIDVSTIDRYHAKQARFLHLVQEAKNLGTPEGHALPPKEKALQIFEINYLSGSEGVDTFVTDSDIAICNHQNGLSSLQPFLHPGSSCLLPQALPHCSCLPFLVKLPIAGHTSSNANWEPQTLWYWEWWRIRRVRVIGPLLWCLSGTVVLQSLRCIWDQSLWAKHFNSSLGWKTIHKALSSSCPDERQLSLFFGWPIGKGIS